MALPVVVAERFTDVVSADKGATEPIKMTCRSESGQLVDAFVKCASPQCTPGGLVRELLGCLLADRLGFEVGAPLLVEVPGELVEVMRDQIPLIVGKNDTIKLSQMLIDKTKEHIQKRVKDAYYAAAEKEADVFNIVPYFYKFHTKKYNKYMSSGRTIKDFLYDIELKFNLKLEIKV